MDLLLNLSSEYGTLVTRHAITHLKRLIDSFSDDEVNFILDTAKLSVTLGCGQDVAVEIILTPVVYKIGNNTIYDPDVINAAKLANNFYYTLDPCYCHNDLPKITKIVCAVFVISKIKQLYDKNISLNKRQSEIFYGIALSLGNIPRNIKEKLINSLRSCELKG